MNESNFKYGTEEDAVGKCPVCIGPAKFDRHLPAEATRRHLGEVFGRAPPNAIAIADYRLIECRECGLVFADPMVAGDADFYGWITGFERYRAQQRWEWRKIKELLSAEPGELSLLEIGCGTGRFLAYVSKVAGLSVVGVDVSRSSIDAALALGLEAYCAELSELSAVFDTDRRFDAVVLSHVLEHIEGPVEAIAMIRSLLRPGGRIYVCVPYSPMSREMLYYDVMNLPPHHLTRWNMRALTKLSEVVNMPLSTYMPRPKSPLKRAIKCTWMTVCERETDVPWLSRMWAIVAHPTIFRRFLRESLGREQVGGRIAADDIMAVLENS